LTDPILPELLKSCQAGDASAVTQLVALYRPAVYRLALSVLDDAEEADEAAQDAFLAALGALRSFRGQTPFTAWLYAITLDVCRRHVRRRGPGRLAQAINRLWPLHGPRPAPVDEANSFQVQAPAHVWQAVARLPEPLRLVVVLRYYHELQAGEIAAVLRIDERAVHRRLSAAHAGLRGLLEAKAEPG
jgi:RNA polymerase sigma-70 factor (ECF subfamily)